MITDKVRNLNRYKGLYKNLDMAIDYINNNDINCLKPGRNDICGDELYVNVMEPKIISENEGVYESHRRYLDLHIDIAGIETVLFCRYDANNVIKEYSEDGDYELLTGRPSVLCYNDENHFVLCMTGEPHMPCIGQADNDMHIRKAVFKIRID